MNLSRIAEKIKPSGTIKISTKVKNMVQEGISVIGFGMGEPDFDTPKNITDAAIKAIKDGFTRYTPTSGILELKEVICEKLLQDNGLQYSPTQVAVTIGAKQAVHNLLLVLCDSGDEVIIPAPYWVSYPEQVKMAGATPVFVHTDDGSGFKLTPESLKAAITSRTKVLIINSPSNPAGVVYTEEEMRALVSIAVENDIYIVSDEIYEKIIYDGMKHVSPAGFGDEFMGKVITVNGFSKAYAMTGWRVGYAAGPEQIIKAAIRLQDHTTSCANSIAQKAAVEALRGDQTPVRHMVEQFDKRRRYMVEKLRGLEGISCTMPEGAFYVFPNVSGLYGRSMSGIEVSNSTEFVEMLIEKAGVALVPGVCFGSDNHVRISFATNMKHIEEGMDRLQEVLTSQGAP
ncbi:MAG: pyridoxal phosphate-dependent aminotransferase [Candidatus Brocadiales bacterium]|nr:pyridoxal phosphate-dependent aminotransferase [Candidatus Bathyanammoxibius sp.]MCQ4574465.1 pyridoxal phosphate-dependent aminotransferase [Candidatus Bathyanammoxibius amoris]